MPTAVLRGGVNVYFRQCVIGFMAILTTASQGLAHGGALLVCQHTGKVMSACACRHEAEQGTNAPTLQRSRGAGCCVLRSAEPSVWAHAEPTAQAPVPLILLARETAELTRASRQCDRTIDVAARQQAPPSTPLYLTIRTLLI